MKNTDSIHAGSRRDFLRDGLRSSALAGLAAVTVILFQRSRGKLTGQTCGNQGICSRCNAFSGCGLPQALSAKAAKSGGAS
jgi:hypothetical protein